MKDKKIFKLNDIYLLEKTTYVDKTIQEAKTFKNHGDWKKFLIPVSYLKLAIFYIYKIFLGF